MPTVYLARITNPRKTLYSRGQLIFTTASGRDDEVHQKMEDLLAVLPADSRPAYEIMSFVDSLPTTRGTTRALTKELYTVKEAATIMSLSKDTLYRLMDTGDLPYIQPAYNHIRRIARRDMESWIERNRHEAA
jgi:excisionase family DNA binding protein